MSELKVFLSTGDIVNVYEDPLTEKTLEGRATLVRLLSDDKDFEADVLLQDWDVRFMDSECILEDMTVRRRIKVS